jgi:hypothetical protein
LRDSWDALQAFFVSLGFNTVELDPRGYRRGSLLAIAGEPIR